MGIIGDIVRRSTSSTVRKEDEPYVWPKPEILVDFDIENEKGLCTEEQISRIKACASLPFSLEGYTSLADIINKLEVKVKICEGTPKKDMSYLDNAESYWQDMLHSNKFGEKAYKALKAIEDEKEFWGSHYLRGCYIRRTKTIKLFPEVMAMEYNGERVDELLVTTFAHETMHAYFDRPDHNKYPYAYFVEEPMAEFGMLLYLHETRKPMFLEEWAYIDVKNKTSWYRYGATLHEKYISGDIELRDYLKGYKYDIGEFEIPDFDHCEARALPGYTPSPCARTMTPSSKKRLKVYIPGGISIYEAKSCDTFVKAIDQAIALAGIVTVYNAASAIKAGKPLISDSYEIYRKYRCSKELAFGHCFHVDTDSSDVRKQELLNKLFKKLCLNWKAIIE